jgi:hypothetical protein
VYFCVLDTFISIWHHHHIQLHKNQRLHCTCYFSILQHFFFYFSFSDGHMEFFASFFPPHPFSLTHKILLSISLYKSLFALCTHTLKSPSLSLFHTHTHTHIHTHTNQCTLSLSDIHLVSSQVWGVIKPVLLPLFAVNF